MTKKSFCDKKKQNKSENLQIELNFFSVRDLKNKVKQHEAAWREIKATKELNVKHEQWTN